MSEGTFYNTVPIEGEELKQARQQVHKQERDVLKCFHALRGLNLITPYSMHKVLQGSYPEYKNTPVDSIKRSFTNLKNAGKIEKNGNKVLGNYGKMVHCWGLIETK